MKTLHTIYSTFAKHNMASLRLLLVMLLTLSVSAEMWAESVTYTVTSTSAVTESGTAPDGSSATYNSTYTNTKCQLTANNSMTLTLSGYDGCEITGLTLSMKSNTSKGAGNMSMKIGTSTVSSIETANFNNQNWHGSWSTSYVDVNPSVTATTVGNGEEIVITIAATVSSLYCQSFTLTYTPAGGGGDSGNTNCLTLSATSNYPFNSTSSSNTSVYSTTIDGITFENKGGYKFNSYLSFNRSLSGAYIANTTPFSGNIESIVVDYNSGGSSYFNMYEGSASKPSSTVVSPSITGTGSVTYTFSGNNPYFNLVLETTGTYCNINSITICYSNTPTLSYTVTATSNNNDYGTVSVSGTTITASPETGYRVSTSNPYEVTEGTATVVDNGDNTFTVTPESDCTVQINFEVIPTHKIHFNTGGLTTIASVDVQESETYSITEDPSSSLTQDCEFSTFVGWTKSNSIDPSVEPELVTSVDMETSDITLYAVYSKTEGGSGSTTESVTFSEKYSNGEEMTEYEGNNFSISFDKGSNSNVPKYYTSGEAVRAYGGNTFTVSSDNDISNIEITFGSSDGSNTITTDNGTYSNGTWTGASKSVKFTIGGTSGNRRIATIEVTTGNAGTTTYSLDPNCTSEVIVTLNLSDGTFASTPNEWNLEQNGTYTITVETGTQIALPTPTKTGYNFDGWHDGKETVTSPYTPTTDITLTAQWTPQKYTIIYKDQGDVAFSGTHENNYPTQHTYGIETTLKGATKIGYTFEGWYTDAVCTNTNKVTTLGATDYTGAITLYAKWTEKALTNYRTACDIVCPGAYTFHTGTGTDEIVKATENRTCFEPADGGYLNEWQIKDYIIPADEKFFVGMNGYFYNDNLGIGNHNGNKSRSVVSDWGNMYLAPAMDENDAAGTPRLGHAEGAEGTLRIFQDSEWDNLYVGFIPDGYKLKFGTKECTFTRTSGSEYRSEVVQYNSTTVENNVSVGVVDADGNYVATNHTQEMRHIFLNTGGTSFWEADSVDNFALYDITNETFTCLMHKTGYPNIYEGWVPTTCTKIIFVRLKSSTIDWNNMHNQTVDITLDATKNLYTINNWNQSDNKSGGTWSVYNRYGQFAMHDNSKSKNWYVHFVPHYVLTYDKNADDATGEMDIKTVAVDAANKGVVVADCGFTRPGYRFIKWRKGTTSTYYVPNGSDTIELNADITLYAQWEKEYTVTYNANGGTTTCEDNNIYIKGEQVTVCNEVPTKTGYTFLGWSDGNNTYTAGGTFTMPASDVTLTAQWEEIPSYIVTYSVGNGDTAPESAVVEPIPGSSITLPSLETVLTCVKFVGWTDAASGYTHGTDKLYKAGDSYTVTENVTLHAVYAAGGGYVLVTDVANLAVGDKVIIVSAIADGDSKFWALSTTQNNSNRGQEEVQIIDNTIEPSAGVQILTLETGTQTGTHAFNTGDGYLYAASSSSNHLKTQTTNDANGSWTIEIDNAGVATIKAQGSNTRNWLRYNSGSSIFSCYATGQADVSIYKESITGYTTDPECVMYNVTLCTPTNGTISVDKTIVDPYGSTILTFAPASGYMLDAVLVTSGNAEVGTVSYTSNQTSDGTVKISNIQSDIEVCATFKAIPYYKVTFIDMNADPQNSTEVFQSEFGGDITAPATASDGCDVTWTFIGWAPSNSLNGTTEVPANLVKAGGTISGANITSNLVYYSVYSNSSDGTPPFSIGKSGTYYFKAITEDDEEYYATGELNSSDKYPTNSTPYIPFLLTYNSTSKQYTIKNTLNNKYLAPDSYDENALTEQDASYSWDVIQPTLYADEGYNAQAKTGEYLFCYTKSDGTSIRYLYCNGSYFGSWSRDNSKYALYLEPASEMHYYNASNCTDEYVTMSFHNPFGSSKAQLQYEVGYEEDYYTNTSKKYVDVFPTLEYAGWTFIGWTAGTPYNDVIGEDNLNDENSSADAPTQDIYKTGGGLSYYLGGDVTMYPVFTKFEDNEPFDIVNGGDYYIYYIADGDIGTSVDEYGAAQRIYAAEYDDYGFRSTQSCADATLFTFTKLPDGKWTIYDNTRNKYVYGVNNDNKLEDRAQTADGKVKFIKEWTIEVVSGNQVNAVSVDGYVLSAYSANAVSGTFKNYDDDNLTNGNGYLYHRVYVGTCTERVYSSNPTNKPAITLSGEPIVTSTQDQSIRAQGELSISATKLAANGTITLTSDNADVYFSTVKDANFTQVTKPLASLTLDADEKGKLATTTVYVHYKPTSTSNLGILTATITATTGTEGEEDYATAETTAHVRNLPAKFVIATKVGATWYALPADMTTASNPLGVVIEVDENNMTATAPNSCTYTLFPVKTTNTEYDRYEEYGDRLRFSAVNNSYKGLWANNSKTDLTINNDMVIDQASDGQTGSDLANNSYYEWKVTTTVVDGHWQYTLQTDQTQNQNYLRYWTSAEGTPVGPKWGTYNAGENKLYFLPVTETQPFEYAVVEWYPTKVLIQTDAAIASPTVKVGGEKVESPELTIKGGKLYEISNLPLETNPNEVLQVSFTADAVNYVNAKVVPIILSREAKSITGEPFATLTQKVYQYADVVVRDGATLTIDGGTDVANTLLGMTIYPTAKVSVAEGKKLSVHNLTFFGGIDEIYDGSAYTINKYGVPQLSLKGILNKTVTNMDYIMRVDLEQMYQVGVPYNVDLYDITYWDGTTMTLGDNLYVSAYDGQKRADREEKSWVWETDFTEKVLKAGIGYTISADKQDAAHEYSIIRMPMKNNITSGNTETDKTVQVYAYDNTKGVEITDNHKGWNYLSNPYMVAISGAEADSKLVVGYLRETGTGPWEWVEDDCRYVTIPYDDGTNYYQRKFSEATLLPFKSFFLQIATSGELSFALTSRQNAPARYLQSSNEQREVEFEVLLANDTRSDNLGFLIGEDYTPAYEINADLEKMIGSMSVYTIYNGYNLAYNALSPANAEEQIPIGYVVPTVGEYTFALDESSDIEDVEHIYLIDYETSAITDLVTDVYTFTALEQKSDTRFAINVALKLKDNAATGLDNMNTNGELPTKFIYQDKIFILHHGVIYDATGKRVITINK